MWEASSADVSRWIGAANRHDVELALEMFAEGAYFSGGPRFGGTVVGRPAIREVIEPYFKQLNDMLLTPLESFFDRNEAVTLVHLVGKLKASGTGSGDAGTPRRVSWKGAFRFVFDEEGKIRSLAVYGERDEARWLPDTTRSGAVTAAD